MEFVEHLRKYLNEEQLTQLMDSLSLPSTNALLLNVEKMDASTLLSIYPKLTPHPIVPNGFLYNKEDYDLGRSIYHELGCFYLQEPSAMVVSYLLAPEPNETILDLCAAPGGKSLQASILMQNTGVIIANDISYSRAQALLENAERLGRGNLIITNNDFSLIADRYQNYFDKIIVDAPCSGSGMFRKDKKMAEDWSIQKVLKFAEIQKSLIAMAYLMLKPGGTMVYSTCSYSYEENEEVIASLLAQYDAELLPITHPLFFVNNSLPYGAHLFPNLFPGEGHYLCLIKKKGLLRPNLRNENKSPLPYKLNAQGYTFFAEYGQYLYLQDKAINLKGLNIIRHGVKVGQIDKNEVRYDIHYARFIKDFSSVCPLLEEEVRKYYQGESILRAIPKGYVLLTFNGLTIDIAKSDGRIIKNRLPKGLRKKFY